MLKLVTSVMVCLLGGFAGSFFTSSSLESWYLQLKKPALNPPSWVFAPVWTALYIMMGVAAYLVWEKWPKDRSAGPALALFALQLALNFTWSPAFFGARSPLLGLVVIMLMWAAIAATLVLFYRVSPPAAYLLVPYLVWVSFAVYLNASIFYLNR